MKYRLVINNRFAQIIALALSLILSAAPLLAQITQAPPAPKAYEERGKLEEIEDRSEDIANSILALAVAARDGNTTKIAEFFDEGARVTALPAEKTAATPEGKWVQKHDWKFTPKTLAATSRIALGKQWELFLANFSEIEDVRFNLRASSFDETARVATALVSFFIIGRDAKGQRSWVRVKTSASIEDKIDVAEWQAATLR